MAKMDQRSDASLDDADSGIESRLPSHRPVLGSDQPSKERLYWRFRIPTIPTTPEETQITEVIVTAINEQKANNYPALYAGGGGSFVNDGTGSYYVAADPGWLQSLKDAFNKMTGDDDGDGVSNIFDKLHGVDDSIPTIDGPDGTHLAMCAPDVYQFFKADGDTTGQFFEITGTHMTVGSNSFSLGAGKDSFSFSYDSHDSITYDLHAIPNPFG